MKNTVNQLTGHNPVQHAARSTCAMANGLELLGDRWTLLIIRDLMFTNRNEFGHLLKSAESISTNILSERLERLQNYRVIDKLPHPNHGKKFIYQLTDKGLRLAPVLIEFALWSHGAIAGANIPDSMHDLMVNHRDVLYTKIRQREALITVDL